jgi:hypothetical protein
LNRIAWDWVDRLAGHQRNGSLLNCPKVDPSIGPLNGQKVLVFVLLYAGHTPSAAQSRTSQTPLQ